MARIPAAAIALLTTLLVLPAATAGSADAPEIADASGDAGPAGPMPGFAWADLLAVWFEETPAQLIVRMQVADATAPPPDGVVGLVLRVGEQAYILGHGRILFPTGPYSGGYLCPADDQGQPTGECSAPPARFDGGVYTVEVPRADLGATRAGDALEAITAESGNHPGGMQWIPADTAGGDAAFVFQTGEEATLEAQAVEAAERPAAEGAAPAPTPTPATREPPRAVPGLPPFVLAAGAMGAALAARRRPRDVVELPAQPG